MADVKIVAVISNYQSQNFYKERLQKHFKLNDRTKDFRDSTGKINTIGWNHDGKRLAAGTSDKTLSISTLDRDRLVRLVQYREHTDSIDNLSWHPIDNDVLATASSDKTIRVWDTKCPKSVSTYTDNGENFNITWNPKGDILAFSSSEGIVTFLEYPGLKKISEKQFKNEINEMVWTVDGARLLLTTDLGSVILVEYPSMNEVITYKSHPTTCTHIKMDSRGNYFAAGSNDSLVVMYNMEQCMSSAILSNLNGPTRSMSFSSDGKMLAIGAEDMMINIADVESGDTIVNIKLDKPTYSLAWHPSRLLLAYTSEEKDKYDYHKEFGFVKLYGFAPGQ